MVHLAFLVNRWLQSPGEWPIFYEWWPSFLLPLPFLLHSIFPLVLRELNLELWDQQRPRLMVSCGVKTGAESGPFGFKDRLIKMTVFSPALGVLGVPAWHGIEVNCTVPTEASSRGMGGGERASKGRCVT